MLIGAFDRLSHRELRRLREHFDDPVAFGDNIWDLRFALEDRLHRDVDLINEDNLKNPYFIQELNETKYRIYG